MNIKYLTSDEALEKIEELLEYDIPSYAGCSDYERIMDIVDLDYYDAPDDLIDEEGIKDRVKSYLDDDWLSAAKNMLTDIDLMDDYWIIDGNGRPRDIDSADCVFLKKEIINNLVDMLDDKDMKKYNKLLKKYGLD